ncbi:unnamed protein product, partial [Musa hybrid cultivar]
AKWIGAAWLASATALKGRRALGNPSARHGLRLGRILRTRPAAGEPGAFRFPGTTTATWLHPLALRALQ